jgi:hypothetical protein
VIESTQEDKRRLYAKSMQFNARELSMDSDVQGSSGSNLPCFLRDDSRCNRSFLPRYSVSSHVTRDSTLVVWMWCKLFSKVYILKFNPHCEVVKDWNLDLMMVFREGSLGGD